MGDRGGKRSYNNVSIRVVSGMMKSIRGDRSYVFFVDSLDEIVGDFPVEVCGLLIEVAWWIYVVSKVLFVVMCDVGGGCRLKEVNHSL